MVSTPSFLKKNLEKATLFRLKAEHLAQLNQDVLLKDVQFNQDVLLKSSVLLLHLLIIQPLISFYCRTTPLV